MISNTDPEFWECFNRIPAEIQKQAQERFKLWQKDAFHPSLHFKVLIDDVWSVRVNQGYRALGRRNGNVIAWFWIGSHAEYDQLLKRL